MYGRKKKKRSLLPFLTFVLAAAVAFSLCREGAMRLLEGKAYDRLPSVPGELEEHAFLQSRDLGPCGTLQGDVAATVVFVRDSGSGWTPEEQEAYLRHISAEIEDISHDAALWGRELDLTLDVRECTISGSVAADDADAFLDAILAAAGLPLDGFHSQLEKELDTDQAAVVFVLNKPGRASARMGSQEEYCFLFEDPASFRHELYHLFGAEDLYYPAEVTDPARECFTESIMLGDDSDKVDDLTAYLMGWSNSLSENALAFLNQTAWVTAEGMQEAYREEALSGYGTREYADGVYTGQMNMGVPQGWGTLLLAGGDSYEGEFDNGIPHGTGTYRWSNGDQFQGAFVHDVRTGFGIYTWADGTRYEGDFLNNAITGSGTFYWTDGSIYRGEFLDGALEGYGTLTYPDGESISGTWHNSEYLG